MISEEFKRRAAAMGYEQDPTHDFLYRKGNSYIADCDLQLLMQEMDTAAQSTLEPA